VHRVDWGTFSRKMGTTRKLLRKHCRTPSKERRILGPSTRSELANEVVEIMEAEEEVVVEVVGVLGDLVSMTGEMAL